MLCHILAYNIAVFAINYKKQVIMAKTFPKELPPLTWLLSLRGANLTR